MFMIQLALLAVIALGVLLWLSADRLLTRRAGKVLLLLGVVVLPLTVSFGGLVTGVERSSRTGFCLSCHEMKDYGHSLFVDNRLSLPAIHYQNRSINRDRTCYACHTDYAMFGDAKAKLNGLRHVWVHYFGKVPSKLSLYQPYPNYNCLHCHDDARDYLAVEAHQKHEAALESGKKSCLSCHNVGHDLKGAKTGPLWQAEPR